MKISFSIFLLLLSGLLFKSNLYCKSIIPASKTYYVNSVAGNDTFDGLSKNRAWASLEKLNSIVFQPGDKILFKAGTSYIGQLSPIGSGSYEAPIIIDKYGNGNKPIISGQSQYNATILLKNLEYWEINNLEITNHGLERKPGKSGISIVAEDFGECHHIYLRSLVVHDVNGSLAKKDGGGYAINWRNSGKKIKSRFVDLRIENCHLFRCERDGIKGGGYTNRQNWYPTTGVIIRNNLLEQIPGDGIVVMGCDGALIERNIMRDCPDILPQDDPASAGIYPYCSDNTIIQYNEVSGHNAKWDGQGFDVDCNSQNTIIQYNYSHDNAGGFLLVCNDWKDITTNTIIRYNVSVNDGIRAYPTHTGKYFSPLFHISGHIGNTNIYNNLFIVPPKTNDSIDITLIKMENWSGPWPVNTRISNNIFYIENVADFDLGKAVSTSFENNIFRGKFDSIPDNNLNSLFTDPLLINPTARGNGFEILKEFRLKKGSPCISSGIIINNNGGHDLFGNRLNDSGKPCIGINESKK